MSSNERALRAVRTLTQFELIEVAADVAQAVTARAEAQDHVSALTQHSESAARDLREAIGRERINPALIQEMRRLYRAEQQALSEWQARLAAAQQREQQAYATLARVRARERSIERAADAERRRQQLKRQTAEIVRADDLWLQKRAGELS